MASLSIICNFKYSYAVTSDIRLCACVLTESSSGKDSYLDNQLHLVLRRILNFF